jgi:hypothetical protein
MDAHSLPRDWLIADWQIKDPGNAGTIDTSKSGSLAIVTAEAETRTLPDPDAVNQELYIYMQTDVGDCVITTSSAYIQSGTTTFTLNDAGDTILLRGIKIGANLVWRLVAHEGVTGAS